MTKGGNLSGVMLFWQIACETRPHRRNAVAPPSLLSQLGVALFFPLLIVGLRSLSHLLEELIIIDLLRVFILHITIFFIGENHTPKLRAKRRNVRRNQHAQRLGLRWITPQSN